MDLLCRSFVGFLSSTDCLTFYFVGDVGSRLRFFFCTLFWFDLVGFHAAMSAYPFHRIVLGPVILEKRNTLFCYITNIFGNVVLFMRFVWIFVLLHNRHFFSFAPFPGLL